MENKEELEKFIGIGADEIDKKITQEKMMTDEEFEKRRKQIEDLANSDEVREFKRQSYVEAYKRLDKKDQEKISREDIENCLDGKMLENRDEIKKLQEERQKVLEERDEELFKSFNKEIGGDINTNKSMFNMVKRNLAVGMVFGMPGMMFITIKDIIDQKKTENKMNDAVKEFIKSNNPDTLKSAEQILQKNWGKIVNVSGVMNLIKSSDLLDELKENTQENKKILSFFKDIKDSKSNEISDLLNNSLEDEQQQEENENTQNLMENMEDIEDEDDPEPVEGMKFM